MYCDIYVPISRFHSPANRKQALNYFKECGYNSIAWTTVVEGSIETHSKHEVSGIESFEKCRSSFSKAIAVDSSFIELSRIHVKCRSNRDVEKLSLQSGVLQSYDIVSAEANSAEVMTLLSKTNAIDVITIDVSKRPTFRLTHVHIQTALDNGIRFEVCYGHAMNDDSAKQFLISNTRMLLSEMKPKHLILSGNVQKLSNIRFPRDVANIGQLLGLSERESIHSVSLNIEWMLMRASARKMSYSGLHISNADSGSISIPSSYCNDAESN